jgi:hypothetical protein
MAAGICMVADSLREAAVKLTTKPSSFDHMENL